jgi:DNA-binding response OmpR family regulator
MAYEDEKIGRITPRILIAQADQEVATTIHNSLTRANFKVDAVFDGLEAINTVAEQPPDLLLLNPVLPLIDGLDILRILSVNTKNDRPAVIMVTTQNEDIDRIVALEMGAEDYIAIPFNPRELLLRVKIVLRRCSPIQAKDKNDRMEVGRLRIERDKRRVFCAEQEIQLTPIQWSLLLTLSSSPGQNFSRKSLMEQIWRRGERDKDRIVDAHIARLRAKLGCCGQHIFTVHGVGYRFQG